MKPTSLHKAIAGRRADDIIILSDANGLTAAELLMMRRSSRLALAEGHRRIALKFSDASQLFSALVALDGRVERILLLPADASADLNRLLTCFDPDLVLTDDRSALDPLWSMRCCVGAASDTGNVLPGPQRSDRERFRTGILFATSGTTGMPKLAEHDFESLTATTKPPRDDKECLRWGLLFDPARFAGMQVALQAIVGGGILITCDRSAPVAEQLRTLAKHGCNAISATPSMWRQILMAPNRSNLSLRQITLGGEIADQAILTSLARQFPQARVAHIYASTEGGAAFAVKDGMAGFPAAFVDSPPDGVSLQVREGRLFAHNHQVARTYFGSNQAIRDENGFVDTGDCVERIGDRFFFRGRANGAINVGGNKLFPEEIERLLHGHPLVAQAHAYAKPNPITGSILVADINPVPGSEDDRAIVAQLRDFCRAHLPRWQVPGIFRIRRDLPISSAGKLKRVFD